MKPIHEFLKVVQLKIKETPLDIKLLFIFSFLMTIASIYIHLESNRDLYKKILPYTGWSPGRGYDSIMLFTIIYSLSFKNLQKRILYTRFLSLGFLAIPMFSGIVEHASISPEDYTSSNPYLRYDSLTPIYTIALPLFWILIILGSLLIFYLKKDQKSKETIV